VPDEPQIPDVQLEQLRAAQTRRLAVARQVVGLNLHDANELADRSGCQLRVVRRDGKGADVTADFVTNRIDVEVEGDIVVRPWPG
jgi:hypothetical protein